MKSFLRNNLLLVAVVAAVVVLALAGDPSLANSLPVAGLAFGITKKNFDDYKVTRQGDKEALRWSLYDTQTYVAAGQAQLSFFKTAQGGAKPVDQSNMDLAGQIQAGWIFRAKFIELRFTPGVSPAVTSAASAIPQYVNDVFTFSENGWLNFKVSQKDIVIDAPLGIFPPLTRLYGFAGDTGTFAAGTEINVNYAQTAGKPFVLDPVVTIAPNQAFVFTLNWNPIIALPSGANGKVVAKLVGQLARDI